MKWSARSILLVVAGLLIAGGTQAGAGRALTTISIRVDVADAKSLFDSRDEVLAGPAAFGGRVFVRAALTEARRLELADDPRVERVMPWQPPRMHDERSPVIGSGGVDAAGGLVGPGYRAFLQSHGFTGPLGVTIDIADSGFDIGSAIEIPAEWRGAGGPVVPVVYARDFTFDQNPHDVSGHGTLNATIAAGLPTGVLDADGYDYGLGVAPGAAIGSTRIFRDNGTFGVHDFYSALVAPARRSGAHVSSNSWGAPANMYTPDAVEYDALVRDADPETKGNQQIVVVFSAGNGGPGGNVESPGTAKNVITVGASEGVRGGTDGCGLGPAAADSAFDVAFFSSGGPLDDGRTKPDLLAPGTHIVGLRSRDAAYDGSGVCDRRFPGSPERYTWSSGTSHAAPAVAGAAALLISHIRRALNISPSPALIRAWLLNSTRYVTGDGGNDDLPSPRQGWGLLDLDRALDGARRFVVDQTDLFFFANEVREYECVPADPSLPVRITLAWTDPPGPPGTVPLVHDLDLEVETNGTLYHGNRFSRDLSIPGGEADSRNTVEGVWLPAGSGPMRIRVRANSVTQDGVPFEGSLVDQDFALVGYNLDSRPAPIVEALTALVAPLEPGGTGQLIVTLRNTGSAAAPATTLQIEPGIGVSSLDGPDEVPALPPGGAVTLGRGFQLSCDAALACGEVVRLYAITGGMRIPFDVSIGARQSAAVLHDDVEGEPNWSTSASGYSSEWAVAEGAGVNGGRAWLVTGADDIGEAQLVSPALDLPGDLVAARLEFSHRYAFEAGFDAGVVEVSDGGPWVDMGPWAISGGYPTNVTGLSGNPLGTRSAYTAGESAAFRRAVFDLSGFAGRTVRIRFRVGTDSRTGGGVWVVDDIDVTVESATCAQAGGALPTISAAASRNDRLKVWAAGLDESAQLEINGRLLATPVTIRAEKGLLKVRGNSESLNLHEGSNRLVVVVGGRRSRPFAFRSV